VGKIPLQFFFFFALAVPFLCFPIVFFFFFNFSCFFPRFGFLGLY